MSEPYVIAITGPAGAGKSTAAAELAKAFERSVNIEADHVKHFIVGGFVYGDAPEGVAQWRLLGENIGEMARNFLREGYTVIINGYINEPAWDEILKYVKLTHKFLLLPDLPVVQHRDGLRQPDYQIGTQTVAEHHRYFSTSPYFDDFVKIDSSVHKLSETVKAMLERIKT